MSASVVPIRQVAGDYDALPPAMRAARRWLLWRSMPSDDPSKKPRKVPFYASGLPRTGRLDSPEDIQKLVDLPAALVALEVGTYTGLGFALGPDGTGSYWQGVDLDNIDVREGLREVAGGLPGYVETSPSGAGLHALGYGRDFDTLASNKSGAEAYAHGRFFTVTGGRVGEGEPACIADFVEQDLATFYRAMGHSPGGCGAASRLSNSVTMKS